MVANGLPKCFQKSIFGQVSLLGRSRGAQVQVYPDHFGSSFPSKMNSKIDSNVDGETERKFMRRCSKMKPKWNQTSMTNPWYFGTCDFLFFVKSITLKTFFYMIRGTRDLSKINKKSMRIRCSKKWCTNQETCSKREPEWEPKSRKYR